MTGKQVNLNKKNFWIYESTAVENPTSILISQIDTTFIPIDILVTLTSSVASGNYVAVSTNPIDPRSEGVITQVRSYICPSKTSSNANIGDTIPFGTNMKKITSYTSYNSGSPVTINGSDGSLFTLFEVYDYIINKLDAFNNGMSYVQRCNQYSKLSNSVHAVTSASKPQLDVGKGEYSNADTSCGMFGSTSITDATNSIQPSGKKYFVTDAKIFKSDLYNNETTYDYMKSIPTWASSGNFTKLPKLNKDPYIDTSKSLIQQLADLINLTNNFQAILETYRGTNTNVNYVLDANSNKLFLSEGVLNYGFELTSLSNDVDKLRGQLDNRVAEILASQNSSVYESQLVKDSATYINVMWSILATSLIYYVFVKL